MIQLSGLRHRCLRAQKVPSASFSRLFYSHRNAHRPRLNFHSTNHMRYPNTTSQIFWAYLTAPSNILFLTTNFIGLGIISTWRGLSYVANADTLREIEVDDGALLEKELLGMDSKQSQVGLLKNRSNEKKDTGLLSNPALEEVCTEEGETRDMDTTDRAAISDTEGVSLSSAAEDDGSILDELELNSYGFPRTRNIEDESIQNMVIDQLLSLYSVQTVLSQMFKEDFNMEIFTNMTTEERSYLIKALYNCIYSREEVKNNTISSMEEFQSLIPSSQLLEKFTNGEIPSYLLLKDLHQPNYHDENFAMQVGFQNTLSSSELIKQLEHFNDKDSQDNSFLINTASTFMNNSISASTIPRVIQELNTFPSNENFKALSNILSTALIPTKYAKNEQTFNDIMTSSILSQNKQLFNQCLENVGILDPKSRNVSNFRSKYKGQFPSSSYSLALRGMIIMNYRKQEVMKTVKSIILGLRLKRQEQHDSPKVMIQSKAKRPNYPKDIYQYLPMELVHSVYNAGTYLKNPSILQWCVMTLNQMDISLDLKRKLLDNIENESIEYNDSALFQLIKTVKSNESI